MACWLTAVVGEGLKVKLTMVSNVGEYRYALCDCLLSIFESVGCVLINGPLLIQNNCHCDTVHEIALVAYEVSARPVVYERQTLSLVKMRAQFATAAVIPERGSEIDGARISFGLPTRIVPQAEEILIRHFEAMLPGKLAARPFPKNNSFPLARDQAKDLSVCGCHPKALGM